MLQQSKNTVFCTNCGSSWHFMTADLKVGDPCPVDSCPSNKETPIGVVVATCKQFDGNGICSVGAIGALNAMTRHWKEHLAEGHSPKIILDDIAEMQKLLESMRSEIGQRLSPTGEGACKKCGSNLFGEYCTDETCPFADWPQAVPVEAFNTMSELNIPIRYGIQRRLRVHAEAHDDGHNRTVEFDAGPWLYQASEQQIVELATIGWSGGYAADAVALYFEDENVDIANLMAFCRSTQGTRNPMGFECSVDEEQAVKWLEQRRPEIWKRVKETI